MTILRERERDIQRTILDYLKVKHIFAWRNNVGAHPAEYKGKKRFVRFGQPGQPDIFAVRTCYGETTSDTQIWGIEVKGPRGEQSQAQREWQTEFEKAGGIYVLAHSVADVIKVLG